MSRRIIHSRGGALLSVLWIGAALALVALALSLKARGEVERVSNSVEGLRAYYLAQGAAHRGLNHLLYESMTNARLPDGRPVFWMPGMPFLRFAFPTGQAIVEVIPESSRMNPNMAPPEELLRLMLALGQPPDNAARIVAGFMARKTGGMPMLAAPGQVNQLGGSSFPVPPSSIEQIEEIMSMPGVTPDLFYGGFARNEAGRLIATPGLRDCLSIYSENTTFDINSVEVPVMVAVGVPPPVAQDIAARRRVMPVFEAQLPALTPFMGPAASRFRLGGGKIYTFRATARPYLASGRLSDVRRTVALTVQVSVKNNPGAIRILRWQDQAAPRQLPDGWVN